MLLYKTNRFHVAVRLSSNRLRRRQNVVRTSVTHLAIASCATFLFLPHFVVFCDLLLNRRTATWNLFISKSFNITRKPLFVRSLCSLSLLKKTKKMPFDVIYCLFKMKQSHWFGNDDVNRASVF